METSHISGTDNAGANFLKSLGFSRTISIQIHSFISHQNQFAGSLDDQIPFSSSSSCALEMVFTDLLFPCWYGPPSFGVCKIASHNQHHCHSYMWSNQSMKILLFLWMQHASKSGTNHSTGSKNGLNFASPTVAIELVREVKNRTKLLSVKAKSPRTWWKCGARK